MIVGECFSVFAIFVIACYLKSESFGRALITQTGELSKRSATPDHRIVECLS